MAGELWRILNFFFFFFFFFCARQKLEWLLPISSTRSRPSFEVETSRAPGTQGRGVVRATWAGGVGVATSFWCRDLAEVRTKGSLVGT